MKQITLKLTVEEARTLYHALIHASIKVEKAIDAAKEFPGSDALRESGKQAEEWKVRFDELAQKMLRNIPFEEWNEKTGTETCPEGVVEE